MADLETMLESIRAEIILKYYIKLLSFNKQ